MSRPKIAIVYYSLYGHVRTLAKAIEEGASGSGCSVVLLQVPETLPSEVLLRMNAPAKAADREANPLDLAGYDGFIFGAPTRFGGIPAQMAAFMDSITGGGTAMFHADRRGRQIENGDHHVDTPSKLWTHRELTGKPAGCFFSTGTQGGGQTSTAMSMVTRLAHLGMLFVPLGYTTPLLSNMKEVHGGSAWGAGCLAGGTGSRQPSELEKDIAIYYGWRFGQVALTLHRGRTDSLSNKEEHHIDDDYFNLK